MTSRGSICWADLGEARGSPCALIGCAGIRLTTRHESARALAGGRLPAVGTDSLARAAALLRERNEIDAELARLMHRPMTSGHLGEWIAAKVFDIELEASAVAAGIDGHFRSGPWQGRTVNVKWSLKREGALDSATNTQLTVTPMQAEQLRPFAPDGKQPRQRRRFPA